MDLYLIQIDVQLGNALDGCSLGIRYDPDGVVFVCGAVIIGIALIGVDFRTELIHIHTASIGFPDKASIVGGVAHGHIPGEDAAKVAGAALRIPPEIVRNFRKGVGGFYDDGFFFHRFLLRLPGQR